MASSSNCCAGEPNAATTWLSDCRRFLAQVWHITRGLRCKEHRHDRLDSFPVIVVETIRGRTINIKNPEHFSPVQEGNDDFRLRGSVADDMPGKPVDVRYHERLLLSCGCAT